MCNLHSLDTEGFFSVTMDGKALVRYVMQDLEFLDNLHTATSMEPDQWTQTLIAHQVPNILYIAKCSPNGVTSSLPAATSAQ